MKAIVLVGGEGTRLRPLTYRTPKQMLPIFGVPMLDRVLGFLKTHGVTEAILSLGYMPDRFVEAYPSYTIAGVPVTYAVESSPLDTAGAIRFAASHAKIDETFVVVNGDILTDMDLTRLVKFHHERNAQATIGLHPVEDPSRFGVVSTSATGQVLAFIEKPSREEAPSNEINAGTYVFEPSVLDLIEPDVRVSVERVTFPLLASTHSLFALSDSSYWLDTGTPAAYLQAHADVLSGHRALLVEPDVSAESWIHPTASVDPSATILRATIDAHCVIDANARVEESVLMPGATVGNNTTVSQSILGPNCVVGKNVHLGPVCVIGHEAVVNDGAQFNGDIKIGEPA